MVEFCDINQKEYLFFASVDLKYTIWFLAIPGLLFLLYPLVGHLTDVYLTRYRSLKWSFCFLILAVSMGAFYAGFLIPVSIIEKFQIFRHSRHACLYVVAFILFLFYIIGLGLFQANAIQFGLDQLLEAPTSKLISFIHWYYWAQNVGSLIFFYVVGSVFFIVHVTDENINGTISQFLDGTVDSTIVACSLIAMTVAVTAVFIKFYTTKKHFYIQKAGLNPFKNIYEVLKYSWKHKVPEHRSAFTYWEEDIPRRIDLGKNKYGGPFTNEEVEDTKTFLRILPLLLCLFGYHLAGDGYSAPEQLQRTSCPSLLVLQLIVINPLHMSTLVSVVGIPLYRLVIVKMLPRLKNIRMLTKMWMGLYLSLLQIVLYIIVVVNHDTTYWQQHHTVISNKIHYPPSRQCYIIRTG